MKSRRRPNAMPLRDVVKTDEEWYTPAQDGIGALTRGAHDSMTCSIFPAGLWCRRVFPSGVNLLQ